MTRTYDDLIIALPNPHTILHQPHQHQGICQHPSGNEEEGGQRMGLGLEGVLVAVDANVHPSLSLTWLISKTCR